MKKLYISLVLVVVFSMLSLGWMATLVYSRMDSSGAAEEQGSVSAYKEFGVNLARSIDQHKDVGGLLIESWSTESRLQLTLIPASEFTLPQSLKQSFESGETLVLEDEEELALSFYLNRTEQVLTLSLPGSTSVDGGRRMELALTILFYFGIILVVFIWLYPLLRRLALLQQSASSFGGGDLNVRIASGRWSYILQIERAFNGMADRIQNLIADNKLLSRAVSHDLKTPLARLRFGVETLAESHSQNQRDKYHRRISSDLDEMESLVNTLLQYAKLDEAHIELNLVSVDLSRFIEGSVLDSRPAKTQLILDLCPEQLLIQADTAYLSMLVNNIIGNAFQYCESKVRVSTRVVNNQVCLVVADDGPGIPEDKDDIIKPFVRGGNVDAKQGHGMGLAIVSKIVEWHGANLAIGESKALGGAEVIVCFQCQ